VLKPFVTFQQEKTVVFCVMKISVKNWIQFLKLLKPFVTFQQEKTVVFCVMKISKKNWIQFLNVLKPFVTFQQEKTVVFCVMKINEKKLNSIFKSVETIHNISTGKNCGFLCHENKRIKTEFIF